MVFERLIKKLYKFFLNLMANAKEPSLREKALKDLSKSISLLFTSDLLKSTLLDFVARKIQQNFILCKTDEQMSFLIEVLSVITQQLYKVEEDFFVSVESSKGSVETVRTHSIFKDMVSKG